MPDITQSACFLLAGTVLFQWTLTFGRYSHHKWTILHKLEGQMVDKNRAQIYRLLYFYWIIWSYYCILCICVLLIWFWNTKWLLKLLQLKLKRLLLNSLLINTVQLRIHNSLPHLLQWPCICNPEWNAMTFWHVHSAFVLFFQWLWDLQYWLAQMIRETSVLCIVYSCMVCMCLRPYGVYFTWQYLR